MKRSQNDSQPTRLVPTVLLALAVALSPVTVVEAQDWPQWRGADGTGVAVATNLPEQWGPDSANVRWRTEIRGEGVSSPIVSNGQVFVTTAYEGATSSVLSRLLQAALVVLAFGFATLVIVSYRRAIESSRRLAPAEAQAQRRGARLRTPLSLLFVLLALVMALRPELILEAGNPGRSWRAGSTLALLGLAAAMTWLRPKTPGRLGAALLLLAITAYLGANVPSGPLGRPGFEKILIAVLPGLVAGMWGVSSYFLLRSRPAAAAGVYDPWMVLLPLVLAALIFVPPNYMAGLQRVVISLDLKTGEVLWARSVFRAPPEQKWPRSSYATPTPATDGQHVFAYFGAGVSSLAFDGRIQWTTRFPEYSKNTRYGAASSPVLTDDYVIILQESEAYQNPRPSWLTALRKDTGERHWHIEPSDLRDSYATPLLVPTPSGGQIVTASFHLLVAFDPESGERLWSLDSQQEQTIASIARSGNLLAVSGGVWKKELFTVRMPDDGSGAPEVLWRSRKSVASVVSPVIYNGMVFTLTEAGVMACYDATSGEMLWRKRLKGEYYGSLVAGDGKVYATSTEGRTTVISAAAEFEQLAVNSSAEGVFASLAVAGGGLLIRSANELFFIEGKARP